VKPGCFKIGNTGGMLDNILHSKLYRPGRWGFIYIFIFIFILLNFFLVSLMYHAQEECPMNWTTLSATLPTACLR
jgi:hypothetical protein